ncbi:protein BTG4 [Callorhinchus milii]|uniref:Anti-proliferative protein domain-containing protein n=1 Tax=Callorhinchus milii TaxID=7868 RepID=A0A4W3HKF8_CALMI|nr:protein BTG4 [Callorhinchus milii]|eukprot:gi/632986074/ref/XP_007910034.1/ PREDICTED: protein BTG4 [Callorhinchus milii]
MKEEIAATVVFISSLVRKGGHVGSRKMGRFGGRLTKILFEKYKNHWYPDTPHRGQAYRCIRVNTVQPVDLALLQACKESEVEYAALELPRELTIWVDPHEVCCRCGEKNQPFTVTRLQDDDQDSEIFRDINRAAEIVSWDYPSGMSSDEEIVRELVTLSVNDQAPELEAGREDGYNGEIGANIPIVSNPNSVHNEYFRREEWERGTDEPQKIPRVHNPNSIYQFSDFYRLPVTAVWPKFTRKTLPSDEYSSYHQAQKPYRMYRASSIFTGPRVDRYHWVNTKR